MTRQRKVEIAYIFWRLMMVFMLTSFLSAGFAGKLAWLGWLSYAFACAAGASMLIGLFFLRSSTAYSRRVINSPDELHRGEE